MSDNFVDPILAEDFDPNGPEPNVVYSKGNIFNLKSLQKRQPPHDLFDPVLIHTKALKEGATEEEAMAAVEAAEAAMVSEMEARDKKEAEADDQNN
tara:strand:- start:623 stop:910 length:288 start_codon:yes stop_codon:yes gene_type:complete